VLSSDEAWHHKILAEIGILTYELIVNPIMKNASSNFIYVSIENLLVNNDSLINYLVSQLGIPASLMIILFFLPLLLCFFRYKATVETIDLFGFL